MPNRINKATPIASPLERAPAASLLPASAGAMAAHLLQLCPRMPVDVVLKADTLFKNSQRIAKQLKGLVVADLVNLDVPAVRSMRFQLKHFMLIADKLSETIKPYGLENLNPGTLSKNLNLMFNLTVALKHKQTIPPEVSEFAHHLRDPYKALSERDPDKLLLQLKGLQDVYQARMDFESDQIETLHRLIAHEPTSAANPGRHLLLQRHCVDLVTHCTRCMHDLRFAMVKKQWADAPDFFGIPVDVFYTANLVKCLTDLSVSMEGQTRCMNAENYSRVMRPELHRCIEHMKTMATRVMTDYLDMPTEQNASPQARFELRVQCLLNRYAWAVVDALYKMLDEFESVRPERAGGGWGVEPGVLSISTEPEVLSHLLRHNASVGEMLGALYLSDLFNDMKPSGQHTAPVGQFNQASPAGGLAAELPASLVQTRKADNRLNDLGKRLSGILNDKTCAEFAVLEQDALHSGPLTALNKAKLLEERATRQIKSIDSARRCFQGIQASPENLDPALLSEFESTFKTLGTRRRDLTAWCERVQNPSFQDDLIKQTVLPNASFLAHLLEREQVQSIAFQARLPADADGIDEYRIQFKRCANHVLPAPVWLHIHCDPAVPGGGSLGLTFKQIRAAHLKSDQQRGFGARWEQAEQAIGHVDAKVFRAPVGKALFDSIKAFVRRTSTG